MAKRPGVFVAGGTGYIGRPLVSELVRRGHTARALVRPGSEGKLPEGATPVAGDARRGPVDRSRHAGAEGGGAGSRGGGSAGRRAGAGRVRIVEVPDI